MLSPLDPDDVPPPAAYRVPWQVLRDDSAHPVVINRSPENADFVRIFRDDGSASDSTRLWGRVEPGDRIELCLCAADLDEVVVTIAWFRSGDGWEYLWRFVV